MDSNLHALVGNSPSLQIIVGSRPSPAEAATNWRMDQRCAKSTTPISQEQSQGLSFSLPGTAWSPWRMLGHLSKSLGNSKQRIFGFLYMWTEQDIKWSWLPGLLYL